VALPALLRSRIEQQLTTLDRSRVTRAAEQITSDYRLGRFEGSLRTPESRVAYLATRLPATFAANQYVFSEVRRLLPDFYPQDLLDLGAGPGTAMWAARETWPSLEVATLLDSNRELLQLGQQLAIGIPNTHWIDSNFAASDFPESDLVVLSYALGELKAPAGVVERAWTSARKVLVVIEPGTPRNFSTIANIRTQLIEGGGHPVAPCPPRNASPMAVANDWCHFAVRLERTAEHRQLKSGTLGYEDEKFSYLAFAKEAVSMPPSRIVRHPEIHGGHIRLTLCTVEGLKSTIVTRSEKESFRAARKANWGDEWPR